MNRNVLDQVDRYLSDQMSTQEKRVFEFEIENNEKLKQQINEHKKSIELINLIGQQESNDWIKQIVQNVNEEPSKSNYIPFKKIFAIAASFVIIVIGAAKFFPGFISNETSSSLAIYNQYYQPFHESQMSSDKQQALDLYTKKKYTEALILFEQISPKSTSENLMLGICYLETGNDQQALLQFKKHFENHRYGDEAKWYAALIYLKQDKIKDCKSLLEAIKGSSKKKDADEILKKLKL